MNIPPSLYSEIQYSKPYDEYETIEEVLALA